MAQFEYSQLPFGAVGLTNIAAPRWYCGDAIPTSGTYNKGDRIFNPSASAAASETAVMTIGWQCTTAGSPGTWTPIYSAALPSTVTVTATAATLSAAARVILLNAATGPTVALPDVTTRMTGTLVSIKNIANNSATLTPLGTNGYADAAAITLTQYQVISLAPGPTGSTIWYKVG